MKNSIVSGMLGVALGLAACGEDGHDIDLDASRDEASGDGGARPRNEQSDAPADVLGGSAFTDLLDDLIGTVLGGGGDTALDFCSLLPGVCPTGEMDAGDSGRDDMRDAAPRGPRRDAGDDRDGSADAGGGGDAGVADAAADAQAADAQTADSQATDAQAADGALEDASEAAVPDDAGDAGAADAADDAASDAGEPDAELPLAA
jgi:hypothetical protein